MSVPSNPSFKIRATTYQRQNRALALAASGLGFAALFTLYLPIVLLFVLSFSSDPLSGRVPSLSLDWYEALLVSDVFKVRDPLLLSLGIGLLNAALCATSALLVGRVLPRMKRNAPLIFMFLLPLLVPGILLGAGVFTYYRVLIGVKMGLWSLLLAHFMWAFPFALLCMLIVASRFDARLLEAAADLGASRWQRFRDVELPLLKPGIFAGGFFAFLLSFNELSRSIFMRSGEMTLPLYLWVQSGGRSATIPIIYAMSTIVALVSMVLVFIAVRMMFPKEN